MDIYSETLVNKKLTRKEKTRVKLLFAATLVSSVVFILVIPFFAWAIHLPILMYVSLILFGVILFLTWRTLKNMQLEFEYIITNDVLDFDVIISQKKRERIISIDIKTIEEIGLYSESNFRGSNFDEVIHAERDEDAHDNFYLIASHPKRKRVMIIFKPDSRMIEALKKTLTPRLSRTLPDNF